MRLLAISLLLAQVSFSAQIQVKVNDEAAVTMDSAELAKLPRHKVSLNDHGKQVLYEGALLHDVLTHAKFDFGKGLHGKQQLSSYVLATASDGYEVVFALAELDPTICDSDVLLADTREGKPLAAQEGPLRIISPRDKRPARSIKMLQEIDVKAPGSGSIH